MNHMMLNLESMPSDPLEALIWLDGVAEAVQSEMKVAWQDAYYSARLQGQFNAALGLGYHSRKKALAFSRAGNERRGRVVRRWGDY